MTNFSRHTLVHVANWLIAVAAYGYLCYLLVTFDGYDQLHAYFHQADRTTWVTLIAVVSLMPLNLLLEACKWQSLLRLIEPLSLGQAFRQVLHGLGGAFITPGRLGEYPTRVLSIPDQKKWAKAIGMGFVGSGALFAVNIIFGLLALAWMGVETWALLPSWMVCIGCIIAIVAVILVGIFQEKNSVRIMVWSMLRYLIFSIQWWLMLRFVGITLMGQNLLLIPIYYLLVTLLPVMPAADPAVKGVISSMVFAHVTSEPSIVAAASVLLWLINTIIPMCIGTFLMKSTKKSGKDKQ
ncbi:MAG: hypothetical protein MJZ89_03930 [Paludibacteraceae bacterium]|nr:hypothetical protein [Paludibacteraceae bacterium]